MAMSYTSLTGNRSFEGSIRNWCNNGNVPAEEILSEAEQEIYDRLRVREMLTEVEGTLNTDEFRVALPTGYRAMYNLRFTGVTKAVLTKMTLDELENSIEFDANSERATGKPQDYACDATHILFNCVADQAYPYRFRYYQALPALAEATNETNFLTNRYPYLLRYACLYKAFEWLRNKGEESKYLQLFEDRLMKANAQSDQEMMGAEIQVDIP